VLERVVLVVFCCKGCWYINLVRVGGQLRNYPQKIILILPKLVSGSFWFVQCLRLFIHHLLIQHGFESRIGLTCLCLWRIFFCKAFGCIIGFLFSSLFYHFLLLFDVLPFQG